VDHNLANILIESANNYRDKHAFEIKRGYRYEHYTYRNSLSIVKNVAAYLSSLGLSKGDKVSLWAPNSPEWVFVFFACMYKGIIVVPIDVRTSAETASKFIDETSAKLIFLSKVNSYKLKRNTKKIYIDDILRISSKFTNVANNEPVKINENDLAEIVYTSGTTGDPKGVRLTHKNIRSNVSAIVEVFKTNSDYRFLSILPLSHTYEQSVCLFSPMSIGITVVYLPYVSSIKIIEALVHKKINCIVTVPEVLKLMYTNINEEIEKKHLKLLFNILLKASSIYPVHFFRRSLFSMIHNYLGGHIKYMICGGAPLEKQVERFWNLVGIPILQGYGMTETGTVISMNTFEDRNMYSVGKVLPNIELKITKEGKIFVKGPNVFPGYFKREDLTRTVFEDGWLETGDVGYLDSGNYLHIIGRTKFMIALHDGKKVYPEDIEAKINTYPHVDDSCVVGVDRNGEEVVHCVLITDKPKKADDLIKRINKSLEQHQKIREYSIYPRKKFPMTASFKIKRAEVANWVATKEIPQNPEISSNESDKLIEILSAISGKNHGSIKNSQFLVKDLGVDSLKRLEIVSLIEDRLAVIISEDNINEHTTVKSLSELVKRSSKFTKINKFRDWPLEPLPSRIRFFFQTFILFPFVRLFTSPKINRIETLKNLEYPVIFVFNHTSHLDVPLLLYLLPKDIRNKTCVAAARDYWFNTQLFSFLITLFFNAFPLVRKGPIKASVDYIGEILDKDYNIVFAPEGTRSMKGNLQSFKTGIGFIATQMQVPIVPVMIEGLHDILPKGKYFPKRGKTIISIGEPMKFKLDSDPVDVAATIRKAFI
jgi:long-chain acyl-CoA synthetase